MSDQQLHARPLLRSAMRALVDALRQQGADVHWSLVFGEDSMKEPTLRWPNDDFLINVLAQQERVGQLTLMITAQIDRYAPQNQVPVIAVHLRGDERQGFEQFGPAIGHAIQWAADYQRSAGSRG